MESTAPIPDRLYFRIGDVAEIVGVKPYVLRYWETEFPVISPEKSSSGQRVYRRCDVETLLMVKHLLYQEKYSIEGARRRIKELRKEGELKTYRQEVVQGEGDAVADVVRNAGDLGDQQKRLERARALAREIQTLTASLRA